MSDGCKSPTQPQTFSDGVGATPGLPVLSPTLPPALLATGRSQTLRLSWLDLVAALRPLQQAGMQVVAAHLASDAVDFREVDYTLPTAVLLGAERRGISADGEQMADVCITVPMVGMVESLNVSVAAGIILAEAHRQRQAAGMYDACRIDAQTYERLFFEWGHSAVRDFCRERGLRYPPLNAEGEIDRPSEWYASVKAGTAPRLEDDEVG